MHVHTATDACKGTAIRPNLPAPTHLDERRQRLLGDDRQGERLAERSDVPQCHNAWQTVIAAEQRGGED